MRPRGVAAAAATFGSMTEMAMIEVWDGGVGGLSEGLRRDGALWRVPEDATAEGLDQVPMAGQMANGLTTVRQPVEAIVARIAGEGGPEKIRVPGPLVIRRSARLLGGRLPRWCRSVP